MLRLLWSPSDAILDVKQKKHKGMVFLTLFVNALFFGLSAALFAWLKMPLQTALLAGAGVFVGMIVLTFYCGLITKLIMKGLTDSGDYFSGLASMVYPYFPLSVGSLLASVCLVWSIALNAQPTTLALLGLAALLLPILVGLSCSALFKCLKELFNTNMMTALIGLFIMKIALLALVGVVYACFILLTQGNAALSPLGLTEMYLLG